MKKLLLIFVIALLFVGCKTTKTVYVPVETIRTEIQTVHDTIVNVKLDVLRDSIVTNDTLSILSNKYSYSSAMWSKGLLSHSLSIKDIKIPVKVQYINISKVDSIQIPYPVEKVVKVNYLTDWQRFRIRVLNWLFIGLCLYGIWRFRKPLRKLIFKV